MKRAAIFLMRAILLMACVLGAARAADPDTFSPVVSYQYLDSLDESGTQTAVMSPVVSYQYFDWPGDQNLTFQNSPSVSYLFQYPAALAVAPDKGTAFGSIQSGGTRDQTFTLTNPSNSTIAGTISVAAPFGVVGGNSYTVAPGQSKTVTVRFSPTAPGSYSAYLTFSNGSSWLLTASAFADFAATTGAVTGRVTSADGTPLNGVSITAVGPGANLFNGGSSPGDYTNGNGAQAGHYAINGLVPFAHYHILASASGQPFYLKEITDVAIVSGQTTPLDIVLDPLPPPPTLSPKDTPVVLVRGLALLGEQKWSEGDSSYWAPFKANAAGQLSEIWDCNEPDTALDAIAPALRDSKGNVINGQAGIEYNAVQLRAFMNDKALEYRSVHEKFPPQINFVAHSMGGLIVRSALQGNDHFVVTDPQSGQLVPIRVGTVIMLATPNAGTVLADHGSIASALFGTRINDLTTNYIRNEFNPSNPWPPSVKLYLYAGSGGQFTTDPMLSAAGVFMDALNSLLPPEFQNDGVVTQSSVNGAYHYRALPFFNLTTVQSFNPVLAAPLATDLNDPSGLQDHNSMLKDPNTLKWVLSLLTGTADHASSALRKSAFARSAAMVEAVPLSRIWNRHV